MALAEVNTSNKWLSSVTTDDFQHGVDINRYTSFIPEGVGELTSTAKSMLENVWSTMSKAFSGIASFSKSLIMDIITGVLDTLMGIGSSLMDMLGIKSALSTVCDNFDAGLYNRYGGDSSAINALGLMGLLSSLLCMGINGAIGLIKGIANTVGVAISGLVSVVANTMDALVISPIKSVVDGVVNSSFVSSTREFIDSKFDIGGVLEDITTDTELSSVFKDTDVSKRLLNGYNGDKLEDYANTLLPNWDINDLGKSANATKSFLNSSKSTAVDSISGISNFSKKDFMMIL